MSDKAKIVTLFFIVFLVGLSAVLFFLFTDIAVLNPKGLIAEKQRTLLVITSALMILVVAPVFFLLFFIAWKYRAERDHPNYSPDWDHNVLFEIIWWGIPFAIISVLGVLAWRGCHELDPFKPIKTNGKPLAIQAIALQWKWLFLYPEQGIATINYVQFPEQVPLDFEITADAPMNSFWIPQLGGQVYAMPGMRSELHLIANEPGSFQGSSANISGAGFAGMTFTVKATSMEEFEQWVESVQASPRILDLKTYGALVRPSKYHPEEIYQLQADHLFNHIVMKYMHP